MAINYCNKIVTNGSHVTSINITNNSYNDNDYALLDFSRLCMVESIIIGDNCFASVKTFKIDGLKKLKTIKIGIDSFTQNNNHSEGDYKWKSFHILNCESLESIQIGEDSFRYFGGKFELNNLPQLESIQIGKTRKSSFNFYWSSFVVRGIELILNIVMIRSSKSTIHYIG